MAVGCPVGLSLEGHQLSRETWKRAQSSQKSVSCLPGITELDFILDDKFTAGGKKYTSGIPMKRKLHDAPSPREDRVPGNKAVSGSPGWGVGTRKKDPSDVV